MCILWCKYFVSPLCSSSIKLNSISLAQLGSYLIYLFIILQLAHSAGCMRQQKNKWIGAGNGSLACLVEERVVNTMVLVLWKYLKYFQRKMHFVSEHHHLAEFTIPLCRMRGWVYRVITVNAWWCIKFWSVSLFLFSGNWEVWLHVPSRSGLR